METRIYTLYWRLKMNGHHRSAQLLDLMVMRPSPRLYRMAAAAGIAVGFVGGVMR